MDNPQRHPLAKPLLTRDTTLSFMLTLRDTTATAIYDADIDNINHIDSLIVSVPLRSSTNSSSRSAKYR